MEKYSLTQFFYYKTTNVTQLATSYIPLQFDVFLTVHHSIDLFQITNLMHTSFIL